VAGVAGAADRRADGGLGDVRVGGPGRARGVGQDATGHGPRVAQRAGTGHRRRHRRRSRGPPGRSCPRGRRGDRKRAGRQLRWSSRRGPGQRRRRHRRLRRLRRRVGRCGRRGRGGTGGEGQQQQHRGPLHRFPPARCEAPPGRTVSAKPSRGAGSSRASSRACRACSTARRPAPVVG